MRFSSSIQFLAIAVFLVGVMSAVSAQEKGSALKEEGNVNQSELLKAISTPHASYPDEAVREGIEGKVRVRIVVDARGNVSEARALSGPPELIPAAIAAANKWKFEPPAHPPVTKSVEFGFGFPKECPGPISDFGAVTGGGGRLINKNGKLVAISEKNEYPWPVYPEAERKAGVAGEIVLSVSLDPEGRVKEIHTIKSLSPTLDRIAIDSVRPLRFKRVGNSTASMEDLQMQFAFVPMCRPTFK